MIWPYYQDPYVTLYLADNRAVFDILPSGVLISDVPYGTDEDMDYSRFTNSMDGAMKAPLSRHTWDAIEGDKEPFDPKPWIEDKRWRRAILWGANRYSDKLPCGSWLIWDKRIKGQDINHFLADGEGAWMSSGTGVYVFSHTWTGFSRDSERREHYGPAHKPAALAEWCIEKAGVKEDEIVVDPYCGASAWVLVAAKRLGLQAVGVEIEEKYAEIAARRLAATSAVARSAASALAGDQLRMGIGEW